MIGRITRNGRGLSESDALRLVQAFAISRITYSLPYHELNRKETDQADILIRTAYKAALGLPLGTSTERLEALGVYNTFEELKAMTMVTQRERLNMSQAGRRVLEELGYPINPQYCSSELVDISREMREKLKISPIPQKMNPKYHSGRRNARAKQLEKRFGNNPDTIYTDAAQNIKGHVIVAASGPSGIPRTITTASVRTACTSTAEAAAVALAIKTREGEDRPAYVLTDSQAACRLFLHGRIPRIALNILGDRLRQEHHIVWCPGHVGVNGNTGADALARETSIRARNDTPIGNNNQILACDVLEHQRRSRQELAAPNPQLTVEEVRLYRKIQTNTYPHLGRWHAIWPTRYASQCPWCGGRPSLPHVTWECQSRPQNSNSPRLAQNSFREPWAAILARTDLETQLSLLDQARRVAVATGVLD